MPRVEYDELPGNWMNASCIRVHLFPPLHIAAVRHHQVTSGSYRMVGRIQYGRKRTSIDMALISFIVAALHIEIDADVHAPGRKDTFRGNQLHRIPEGSVVHITEPREPVAGRGPTDEVHRKPDRRRPLSGSHGYWSNHPVIGISDDEIHDAFLPGRRQLGSQIEGMPHKPR